MPKALDTLAEDDEWHEKRPAERQVEVIGRDQKGRAVYADRCVIVPGSRRPDGTRRKDQRIRAEQLADGSWKSFVPQDEVQAFETRAHRAQAAKGRTIPGYSPDPIVVKEKLAPKPKEKKKEAPPPAPAPAPPEATDPAKKVRNLKKKLKQVAELRTKVDAGHEPDADQLDKLQKAHLLQAELDDLEEKLAELEVQ